MPRNLGPRNENFTGRVRELTELRTALARHEMVGLCAVQGIGGIGKSALARAYAYLFRLEYLGGQFEIDLSTVHTGEQLQARIVDLARDYLAVPIPPTALPERQIEMALAAFNNRPAGETILLILDNLNEEDAHLLDRAQRGKRLPSPEKVHTVITTRLGPKSLKGIEAIALDVLSPAEALELMFRYCQFAQDAADAEYQAARAGNYKLPAETEIPADAEWKAALAIANRLGRHTLALTLVAAYLGLRQIRYGDFLRDISAAGIGVALDAVGRDDDLRGLLEHPETLIEPLFARSVERLSPLAQVVLEYASLLPADHIPVAWLEALVRGEERCAAAFDKRPFKKTEWEDTLTELADLQFLPGDAHRRMHRVLQEVIRQRMNEEIRNAREARMVLHIEDRAIELQDTNLPPEVVIEVTALEATVRSRFGVTNGILAKVAHCLGNISLTLGRLGTAREFLIYDVTIRKARSDGAPENAAYASLLSLSYSRIGHVYQSLGDSVKALEYHEKALQINQRLSEQAPENADYSSDLALSFEWVGDVYQWLGERAKARQYFVQSLQLYQRLAEQSPENVDYSRGLARSFERMGDVYMRWERGPRRCSILSSRCSYASDWRSNRRKTSTTPTPSPSDTSDWEMCIGR